MQTQAQQATSISEISERDVQRAIVDLLRWRGWMVRELSQPRMVSGDIVGVPDVIAFHSGHTLLIECKRPGGRLRDSQKRFIEEIDPHLDTTLQHMVASDIDEFQKVLLYHEQRCHLR